MKYQNNQKTEGNIYLLQEILIHYRLIIVRSFVSDKFTIPDNLTIAPKKPSKEFWWLRPT